MFDWAIRGLGSLFGFVGDAVGSAVGWAWGSSRWEGGPGRGVDYRPGLWIRPDGLGISPEGLPRRPVGGDGGVRAAVG